MGFGVEKIPNLAGKVAIITGANTGIGKVCAEHLARKGAHVILACRSAERTQPVVEELKKVTQNDQIEFMPFDASSLQSVLKFAQDFKARNLPLHILLNNAGIMFVPYGLSVDGMENHFATNHVGHFLLTVSLMDVLERSQPSRVICLTSSLHASTYPEGIMFDRINDEAAYSPTNAYGQSKLCNLLFAKELAKRVEGKNIYVNAVHPGYVATDLQRNVYEHWNPVIAFAARLGHLLVALNPLQGSLTSLYVATSPEIETKNIRGLYFVPIAKEATTSAFGSNMEMAKKLWDFTEALLVEKLGDSYKSYV